jgi:DNA polymerase III alpha subunit (gram-positive type)
MKLLFISGVYVFFLFLKLKFTTQHIMMIPDEATRVNHITNEMVENAPDINTALKKFTVFCGQSAILVAHNADFDSGFLHVAYTKHPQLLPGNPIVDSLRVARSILPELKSHKLGDLAHMFQRIKGQIKLAINNDEMHRAVYDCEMLMEVFVALMRRRFKEKDWEMANIMASLAKYKGIPLFINK